MTKYYVSIVKINLTEIEIWLILVSTVTGCVSISAFAY